MPQLPSTHLDKAIIPEGWTNWSGCQGAINLSFALSSQLQFINQRIIMGSHRPPTPVTHYRGKIIIGGSYGIRHPSTSCRIELMLTISIFVLTNVAAMYIVTRTWLQPIWSREVYSLLGRLYCVPVLSTVESDSLESTDGFHHCSSNPTIRSNSHRLSSWCTCAHNGFRHFPPAAQPTETLPFEGFRSNRPQLISTE